MQIIIEDAVAEQPEYESPAKVGETVFVTGLLCTNNSNGGTEILRHAGVSCSVTKAFWDYETGWRYHGRVEDESALADFAAQATSEHSPEYFLEKYPDQPELYERVKKANEAFDPGYVYFSEHDFPHVPVPRPQTLQMR